MRKVKILKIKLGKSPLKNRTTTGERAVQEVIGLNNMAMATSGDYRIYFEENGSTLCHMKLIRKTGYPIQHHLASITRARTKFNDC